MASEERGQHFSLIAFIWFRAKASQSWGAKVTSDVTIVGQEINKPISTTMSHVSLRSINFIVYFMLCFYCCQSWSFDDGMMTSPWKGRMAPFFNLVGARKATFPPNCLCPECVCSTAAVAATLLYKSSWKLLPTIWTLHIEFRHIPAELIHRHR